MTQRNFISALFVIALITFDIVSIAHAKTTIYKVTKVSTGSSLRLRAWPSTKSRIKKSLPFNAKNITETGKSKRVGRTKWIEVRWKDNRGWVNKSYLKKTGVLVLNSKKDSSFMKDRPVAKSRNKVFSYKPSPAKKGKISSRNTRSLKSIKTKPNETQMEMPPQEFSGDRYDQTIELGAKEVKTSYSSNVKIMRKVNRELSCSGNMQEPWDMKININGNNMRISFLDSNSFQVPLRYHEWTSKTRARMSLGGSRGRNLAVDVNLEKTNFCHSSIVGANYEIKATINNKFYSGCCR